MARARTALRPSAEGAALLGVVLALAACTGPTAPTVGSPAPTVTVTVTAPAPSSTSPATSAPAVLQPEASDLAGMAYRGGATSPETRFTVPADGYEIVYLCRNDGLAADRVDDIDAGLHAGGAGGSSDTGLTCDDAIHTITVDAGSVREDGRAGTIRTLSFTGDRQDVLGIDLAVRALG